MTALFRMTPPAAINNSADMGATYAKAFRQLTLEHRLAQGLDFLDFRIGQFCSAMSRPLNRDLKSGFVGMERVPAARDPLKIAHAIIRFVAIDMVDLMIGAWRLPVKSPRYQTVNRETGLLAARAQCHAEVAVWHPVQAQNALPNPPRHKPFNRSDPTIRRDLMRLLKPMNSRPNFAHKIILVTLAKIPFLSGKTKPIHKEYDQ